MYGIPVPLLKLFHQIGKLLRCRQRGCNGEETEHDMQRGVNCEQGWISRTAAQ